MSQWGDRNSLDWPGPRDNTTPVPEVCAFEGHREGPPDYKLNLDWYHILAAKLVFVLVYEVRLIISCNVQYGVPHSLTYDLPIPIFGQPR